MENNIPMKIRDVKCKKCGWIYFSVSLQYVLDWENDWVPFWQSLDNEGRDAYGLLDGPPKIEDEYLNCGVCGNSYKHFIDASNEDMNRIYGSTVGGILDRDFDFKRENNDFLIDPDL